MFSASDFETKRVLICGIQGSGKTTLTRWIMRKYFPYQALVYSPYPDEWKDEPVYFAQSKDFINGFPFWVSHFMKLKLKTLVVDDADLLFKTHFDTCLPLRQLIISHRHLTPPRSIFLITRRPQDLPTRIYSLCDVLILFHLDAPQAVNLFNSWCSGLGDEMAQLQNHDFIIRFADGRKKKCRLKL